MAYNTKIKESKNKVYNHAIATKIIDMMDKLRMYENENSSRRWIWELLQNAKDVAYEDEGVSVLIETIINKIFAKNNRIYSGAIISNYVSFLICFFLNGYVPFD